MSLFQNATYVASAHRLQDLPPPGAPEIAFAGRSNAGKSSAINALANRTRLAFVSKTPGRTQTINLFRLAGGGILADLPGYGYAKVPEALRRHWEATLSAYLRRGRASAVALVMGAQRPLTERDELMLGWFRPTGRRPRAPHQTDAPRARPATLARARTPPRLARQLPRSYSPVSTAPASRKPRRSSPAGWGRRPAKEIKKPQAKGESRGLNALSD
jgi:ribosome biogenesis GTP-binding protein YsxC/EngB